MKTNRVRPLRSFSSRGFIVGLGMAVVMAGTALAADLPKANVTNSSGDIILPTESRTLDSYTDYVVNPDNLELSRYGGWKARRVNATGFFRVEQIDGRWWAVDPEGYLYIAKAVNSVNPDNLTPDNIYDLLQENGFNGIGRWSNLDNLISSRQEENPLAYTPTLNFLGEYDGRSDDLYFPVFDDDFQRHADDYAVEEITQFVNDPAVFGYMSDNELRWYGNLEQHLALNDESNKNYTTAVSFLESRGKTASNWNDEDEDEYVGLIAEAFYSAVSSAIKRVDPNHMYLGSRANSRERYNKTFMENAGKYVDVFSMNHYSRWGSYDAQINEMADRLNKPLMITEFYAQENFQPDSTGAGFRVTDQDSRGLFYQNYVTTLLESKDVVGFHWFKFQDDGNGNKGIVDVDGNAYGELLGYMNQLHTQIYDFISYADSRSTDEVLRPEADAYYSNNDNRGEEADLRIDHNSETRAYLRFDVSQLDSNIDSAVIELKSVRTTGGFGRYSAELVLNDVSWDETGITGANNPPGATLLHEWTHGADVEIDVTDEVRDALAGDGKLSVRISSLENTFRTPYYGSRENENSNARPELRVDYVSTTPPTGGGNFKLIKRNATGFAIDGGSGAVVGRSVELYNNVDNNNLTWTEIDLDNGFVAYQKFDTNVCIDGGSGGANRQNVTLDTCNSSDINQQWQKIDVGSGFYQLQKRGTNFSLDGDNGGARDQNVFLLTTGSSNQNQHWRFEAR